MDGDLWIQMRLGTFRLKTPTKERIRRSALQWFKLRRDQHRPITYRKVLNHVFDPERRAAMTKSYPQGLLASIKAKVKYGQLD